MPNRKKNQSLKAGFILMFAIVTCQIPGPSIGSVDWFAGGLSLWKARQYSEAIEAFSIAVEVIPHDYEAYNNRGVTAFLNGRAPEAIHDLNHALTINPYFAAAFSNRATVWFARGEFDRAISDCTEALKINKRSFHAYYIRAFSWEKTGDIKNAYSDYLQVREIPPEYAEQRSAEMKTILFNKTITSFLDDSALRLLPVNRQLEKKGIAEYLLALKPKNRGVAVKTEGASLAKKEPRRPDEKLTRKQTETPQPIPKKRVFGPKQIKRPYTIHVGSFKNHERVLNWVLELKRQGYAAFLIPINITGKGLWYRAFIGHYENRIEAGQKAEELKKQKFKCARVMQITSGL